MTVSFTIVEGQVDSYEFLPDSDGMAVVYSNGDKIWFKNGLRHREDGPACILASGYMCYYKNNKLHREDGPAEIYSNGFTEWWINNECITFEVNNWMKENNITYPFNLNEKILFQMTFN